VITGVVTTSYPRHPGDWAGTFVRARVLELAARGRVEVLCAGSPGPEAGDPDVEVVRLPGELFSGPGAPEVLERDGLLPALGFTARLATAIAQRAGRWGAVESHWLLPSALLCSTLALPHRAFAHGGDVALLERISFGGALARRLARAGMHIQFVSEELRGRFVRLAGLEPPSTVAPAPFDRALFRPRTAGELAAARLGRQRPLVLGVGRLVPVKGFDVAIRALARFPRAERPALVLVGEGPERERLRALAAGRVDLRLTGALPPEETARWMRAADLYVQPSRRLATGRAEGMPLALREALAVGVPAVASAIGGIPEITPEILRLRLVRPDDPAALARECRAECYPAQTDTQWKRPKCEAGDAHTPLLPP
jgi:glycosyltransferase involved in cell wall biosynthesis